MKNDLIHTRRNEAFTSSNIVSDMLEVPNKDLLRTIDKVIKLYNLTVLHSTVKNAKHQPIFIETTYKNKRGRVYKSYDMNEAAYMLLAMQLSKYKNAREVQIAVVTAFSMMKEAILNHDNPEWNQIRSEGKEVRKIETDVIKDLVEYARQQGATNYKFIYSNYTRMMNKEMQLIIESQGMPIKDLSTKQDLLLISIAEKQLSYYLQNAMKEGLHYKDIYKGAKAFLNQFAASLNPMILR